MLANFHEPIEEELRLLNHLIKQYEWSDKIFPFIPEYRGPRLLMKHIKSINKIFDHDEPFAFVYDIVKQPCVMIENDSQTYALVNVKSYVTYKKDFKDKDFYSKSIDDDYVFALLFLFETYAKIELSEQKKVVYNAVDVQSFSRVACRTLEIYMQMYGRREHHATLVEYFFDKFSKQFKGESHFEHHRTRMLMPLGYIVGGYVD